MPSEFVAIINDEMFVQTPSREVRFIHKKIFDVIPDVKISIDQNIGYVDEIVTSNTKYTSQQKLSQLKNGFSSSETQILYYDGGTDQEKVDLFWKMRVPGNVDSRNQEISKFMAKVSYVDQKFAIKGYKEGWKTDRGKVYLRYGEPNEIIENLHPINGKPYIVWYYYERDDKYVFKENQGGGEYELSNTELD
jgi:GWxTD domain-containing protein